MMANWELAGDRHKSGEAKKHVLRRFHQSSNHPLLARVSLDLVMHGGIEPRSFSQRLGASGRSRSTVKYRRRHHFLKDGSRGTTAFGGDNRHTRDPAGVASEIDCQEV